MPGAHTTRQQTTDNRQRTKGDSRQKKRKGGKRRASQTKTNSIFQEQIQAQLDECKERCATARQSEGAMQTAMYGVSEDDMKEEKSPKKYPSRCEEKWRMV